MPTRDVGCEGCHRAAVEDVTMPEVMSHGLRAGMFALQIIAPKCAVCWTTYAGLLGASWFAATRYSPVWFCAALCVTALSLWLVWREARHTRRYFAACTIAPGWVLVLAGAFVGFGWIRWAGVLWLGMATALPYWRNRGLR